ncbi:MAG: hypothetical protein KF760_07580 [Candidatus Eremiobacteraeota bacterium]|nr:hypothetical protein [Candidatus Eremiobacteraeota bacterium]MCW5871530.1 hypothetical protein [Candidatus Eremiobacteraeota bacterium]
MAVSMIRSYSNTDSEAGGSRLLDFSSGNSDAGAAAPMDSSMMMPSAQPMMDTFQSSESAPYIPPPQAAPTAGGSFDFVG